MQSQKDVPKFSLPDVAREQLDKAAQSRAGRSTMTLYGGRGHALRQTLIALTTGMTLDEHENPGEATLTVVEGRVRLHAGDMSWEGRTGDLIVIPQARHSLEAVEDSVALLTVTKRHDE